MLDLFSGTGSIGRVFADRGYEVTRMDWDAKFEADIVTDIRKWDFDNYPQQHYQVIAASPPCTEYSTAMTSRARNLQEADEIVKKPWKSSDTFNQTFGLWKIPKREC